MKRLLSHVGHFAFFLLGLYLAFRGVEDFGLLLFGNIADATVLDVSTRTVRVGKRGRGVQHYAKYVFSLDDGRTYHGTGEMSGSVPAERGVKMPVRYLSFSPSVNAPKDDVIGTGAFLTIIGGFLAIITLGAWRRKLQKDKASLPVERTKRETA